MKCFSLGDLGSVLFSGHSRFPVAWWLNVFFGFRTRLCWANLGPEMTPFFSVRNHLTTLSQT